MDHLLCFVSALVAGSGLLPSSSDTICRKTCSSVPLRLCARLFICNHSCRKCHHEPREPHEPSIRVYRRVSVVYFRHSWPRCCACSGVFAANLQPRRARRTCSPPQAGGRAAPLRLQRAYGARTCSGAPRHGRGASRRLQYMLTPDPLCPTGLCPRIVGAIPPQDTQTVCVVEVTPSPPAADHRGETR